MEQCLCADWRVSAHHEETLSCPCEECMLSLLMQYQFYRQYITCIVQIHRAMMLQADRRYIMGLCIVTCTTLWLLNALYFLFLLFYLCVCLVWMEAYALMTLSCSWPLIWLAGSWPDPSTTRCLALGQPLWPGLEWVCVNFRHTRVNTWILDSCLVPKSYVSSFVALEKRLTSCN